MNYTEYEIIAGLRSLLSTNSLLTIRKVQSGSKQVIDSAGKLTTEGYCKNEEKVIRIDAGAINSPDELRTLIHNSFPKNSLPEFITIPGIGSYAVANCATNAESMLAGSVASFQEPISGRMQNKVVVVTGGAQGFGAGIAESFYREGANLVIADLNEEVGKNLVNEFNSKEQHNRAFFVKCDVSKLESVEELVNEAVLHFGGIDVMISNAGILRAGGLEEMTAESFELMTRVNYIGYFNCAKAASKIMKVQSAFSENRYFDILQINSKSGLRGSNKNFAYAGGKFGGIGLTQSFALELMPFRIKVNSICPGNFFDGPLWSDPEKGLFVQYLNAGKIPGAKTIEDVKKFYEKQVPAGRGCGTEDVAKAAFYAIEQEYETGQAIPVTGGQVMLN